MCPVYVDFFVLYYSHDSMPVIGLVSQFSWGTKSTDAVKKERRLSALFL